MAKPDLRLAWLYPDLMNIYGDRGNIIALVERCRRRDIAVDVEEITVGQQLDPARCDLIFFGGGQDREQLTVAADLARGLGAAVGAAVEGGAALLAICGGYQLLARYYQPADAPQLAGTGLFDAWTEASATRMIGNVTLTLSPEIMAATGQDIASVVGFENHSGKTRLGPGCVPLGRVVRGHGNNGEDGGEGAVYRHAIGCYLHGSLLPKNPHLCDLLLRWALARRHGEVRLPALDDTLEWSAHRAAARRPT